MARDVLFSLACTGEDYEELLEQIDAQFAEIRDHYAESSPEKRSEMRDRAGKLNEAMLKAMKNRREDLRRKPQ